MRIRYSPRLPVALLNIDKYNNENTKVQKLYFICVVSAMHVSQCNYFECRTESHRTKSHSLNFAF